MTSSGHQEERELLVEHTDAHFLPEGCVAREYLSVQEPPQELVTSVFGFIFCGDNVLLTKGEEDHQHEWEIPGGHREEGETLDETFHREVFEETGIVAEKFARVGYIEISVPPAVTDYAYPRPINYMVEYVGIVSSMHTPNELGKWVSVEEARENSWVQYHRALFEAMFQESHYLSGRFSPTYVTLCDEKGSATGETALYDTVHRKGWWHKGVHVWLVNSKGELLIQRRGKYLQATPGIWECTAAGHVDAGHTSTESAIKELQEEVGIEVEEGDLELVGTIRDQFTLHDGTFINNEFDDIYLIRKDVDIETLKKENDEISDLAWFSAREYLVRGMAGDKELVLRPDEYRVLKDFLFP